MNFFTVNLAVARGGGAGTLAPFSPEGGHRGTLSKRKKKRMKKKKETKREKN